MAGGSKRERPRWPSRETGGSSASVGRSLKRVRRESPGLATGAVESPATTCRDDEHGHFVPGPDELVLGRYRVRGVVGEGTFAKVWEAEDLGTERAGRRVAVKVVRSIQRYTDAARIELDILRDVTQHDGQRYRCATVLASGMHGGHFCIVFDLFGPSLYDALHANHYRPFLLRDVQRVAQQSLRALAFLHQRLRLIHTDLKPENIVLTSRGSRELRSREQPVQYRPRDSKDASASYILPSSVSVCIVDFGNAVYERHRDSAVVSTRQYRAPEVILGTGWSYPCDVWSLACILVELYLGDPLFRTHDSIEHLAMIEAVLGPLPRHMTRAACKEMRHVFADGYLRWPALAKSTRSQRDVARLRPLRSVILSRHDPFLSLLLRMLEIDPERRITAAEALHHPFLTMSLDHVS